LFGHPDTEVALPRLVFFPVSLWTSFLDTGNGAMSEGLSKVGGPGVLKLFSADPSAFVWLSLPLSIY
jgi:hypothetical protein